MSRAFGQREKGRIGAVRSRNRLSHDTGTNTLSSETRLWIIARFEFVKSHTGIANGSRMPNRDEVYQPVIPEVGSRISIA